MRDNKQGNAAQHTTQPDAGRRMIPVVRWIYHN
jgi:hypothetical protein